MFFEVSSIKCYHWIFWNTLLNSRPPGWPAYIIILWNCPLNTYSLTVSLSRLQTPGQQWVCLELPDIAQLPVMWGLLPLYQVDKCPSVLLSSGLSSSPWSSVSQEKAGRMEPVMEVKESKALARCRRSGGGGTPGLCSCQFLVSSPLWNSGAQTQGLARAHPDPKMLLESLLLTQRDNTGYHRTTEGSSSGQVLESPLGKEVSKAGVLFAWHLGQLATVISD